VNGQLHAQDRQNLPAWQQTPGARKLGEAQVAIVQNPNVRVEAEQQPQPSSLGLSGTIILVVAVIFAFRRERIFSPILAIIGICILVFSSRPDDDFYRMELDREHGTISWEARHNDKVTASEQSPATAYKTAVLDTSNAGGRIVLVRPDGEHDYPLGGRFLPDQKANFVLVKDLQDMIQAAQIGNRPGS
jgi:hypothetical protein